MHSIPVEYVDVRDRHENDDAYAFHHQDMLSKEYYLRCHVDEIIEPGHHIYSWFHSSDYMKEWAKLMPSAAALYPLQHPDEDLLPNGAPIDQNLRNFFLYLADARGIRTRATVMSNLVTEHFEDREEKMNWTSIACGSAVPLAQVLTRLSVDAKINLVDMDEGALAFAQSLLATSSMPKISTLYTDGPAPHPVRDVVVMNRNLIRTLSQSSSLVDEIGRESQDMVDMLGIFEYFKAQYAVPLLSHAFDLVAPGGVLVLANMLDTHPELHLNQRVVQWPKIHPRSFEQVHQIVKEAGITSPVRTCVAQDKVYAVLALYKEN